jgi:quercetin dioxygenase-like cupin family protein
MSQQTRDAVNYRVTSVLEIARSVDLWVRELTVVAGEEVPWHKHSQVSDRCYGLEGVVLVESIDAQDQRLRTLLRPGQACDIPAGTRHRLSCAEGNLARYLLVQRGPYDFEKVAAPY